MKPLIFPLHENLDCPKFPNYAITFDLSRLAKSSLTATPGFLSLTKVVIKKFPLFRSISAINYPFRSLCLTPDSPKKVEVFFNMEFSRFSEPGLSKTTYLMSSFKNS